jgi:arabinofuranosyltransferase
LKRHLKSYLPLIPALLVYGVLAWHLDFYQDDAYISYRYVANYLNGDGLVYNIGEHIEGYTNFGWVIYLIFWGMLGAGYVVVSKITGFILGAAVIVVAFLIARLVFDERHGWFTAGVAFIVGINQSLAYWSPAGLETAAFALCAVLSLYFYLSRNWLLICTLLWAVLLRPEGAMLTGMLIIIEFIQDRKLPSFTLISAGVAFVLSLPYVFFKLTYYGSVLPNPFYAKTSFDLAQLTNGLEYTGRFFTHYGFYGVGFVVPLLFWRKLTASARSVWLYTVIYTLYIVLIGGDVLKVHRFFLPLFGTSAILILLSLALITEKIQLKTRNLILFLVMIPLLALTYFMPHDFVETFNFTEKAFTHKQQFRALEMKKADSTDFSVALATIGIFGYELIGHDIIDLVGLTDSTIARYSEEPIPGMQSTWKEQKHNSRYLLGREPSYIIFSTGIKPSAPAEKALLLYPQFLRSYRTVAWYFHNPVVSRRGVLTAAFKKVRPLEGKIEPTYPVEYVENYKLGLDNHARGDHARALPYYNKAIQASPRPYNLNLLYQKAYSHIMLRQESVAVPLLQEILKQDSLVFEAHKELYLVSLALRDSAGQELHRRWLKELVPWYFPRLDSIASQMFN